MVLAMLSTFSFSEKMKKILLNLKIVYITGHNSEQYAFVFFLIECQENSTMRGQAAIYNTGSVGSAQRGGGVKTTSLKNVFFWVSPKLPLPPLHPFRQKPKENIL